MKDQNLILILVIAFFLLGCSFSCNGMKENFTNDPIGDACTEYCRGKDANCYGDCTMCLNAHQDNNLLTSIKNGNETEVFEHLAGKCLGCKRDMEERVNDGDFDYFDKRYCRDKDANCEERFQKVKENIKIKLKESCFNISNMLKR